MERSQRSRILNGSHNNKAADTSSKIHVAFGNLRRTLSSHKRTQSFDIARDYFEVSCAALNKTPSAILEDFYEGSR